VQTPSEFRETDAFLGLQDNPADRAGKSGNRERLSAQADLLSLWLFFYNHPPEEVTSGTSV